MNTVTRGFIVLGILIAVIVVACVGPAFFWLPASGNGVPLPVITLPAEVLKGNVLPAQLGYDITNTFTSMILVDVIMLVIGFVVYRATSASAPDRFVPKGFTNFMELLTQFLYDQGKALLGNNIRKVFPVAATIFLMLMISNWIKLFPGTESVGIVSCAEPGQPSYSLQKLPGEGGQPAYFLKVDSGDLGGRAGTPATEADTHACEVKYPRFTPPIVTAKEGRGELTTEGEAKPAEGEVKPAEATPEATKSASQSQIAYTQADATTKRAAEEAGNPNSFVIVPFFRAYATDLNLPIALALIVVLLVQFWGVTALGPAYFFKFINVPALGNLQKNPLGAIDFLVGLIEIISEISRIISLTFRLFGNIFAGGILVIVLSFLVGFLLPAPFYLLEIFVGAVQAYVFAMLTFIYAGQAMTAHHADDDHGHEEHAH